MRSSTRESATSKRPARRRHLTPSARVGAAVLVVIALAAGAPWIFTRASPDQVDILARLAPPSHAHPLGTDNIGRDLLARLVHGARISLTVALISVGGAVCIGVTLGLLAGYFGGWTESVVMRIVDVFLAFPAILLALALVAVLGAGVTSVVTALTLVFWTQYARVVRATALAEKQKVYVEAARAIGADSGHACPDANRSLPARSPGVGPSVSRAGPGACAARSRGDRSDTDAG